MTVMSSKLLKFSAFIFISLFSFVLFSNKANAITNILPETTNGTHYLVVARNGNGNNLDAPSTYARVYFNSPAGGTVLIWDADNCSAGPDSNTNAPTIYSSHRADANENWNIGAPVSAVGSTSPGPWNGSVCGVKSLALNGLTESTDHPGTYTGVILARHIGPVNGGGVNAFKYSAHNADSSNAMIGQYSDINVTSNPGDPGDQYSFFATQDRLSANSTVSNFEYTFATPCSWPASKTAYLKWRDADFGVGNQGTNPPIGFFLVEYDRVSGVQTNAWNVPVTGGEDAFEQWNFTARVDKKYKWIWYNVRKTNGLQIYMPFAQIDYIKSCGGITPGPTTSRYTPTASSNLNDIEEPTLATFNTGATLSTGPGHNATVKSEYYILRNGSTVPEYIAVGNFDPPGLASNPIDTGITTTWNSPTMGISDPITRLNLQIGDRVCSKSSVDPSEVSIDYLGVVTTVVGSVSSSPSCKTFVNQPFLSFYGGDVNAGSGFGSGCTIGAGKIAAFNKGNSTWRGSGAQLAVRAFGSIDKFTSSRINNTPPNGQPKGLTFANDAGTYGGNFGQNDCMPDYFATLGIPLPPSEGSGPIVLNTLTDGTHYFSGNVQLSGSIPNSRRLNLFIEGDLTLNSSNIDYASTAWATYADIPSLHVFVKGNIYIDKSISSIAGFYVAQPGAPGSGVIDTCSNGSNSFVSLDSSYFSACNNKLTVKGSLSAQKTKFRRLANSMRNDSNPTALDPSASSASEVFVFSPNDWIIRPEVTGGETSVNDKFMYYTLLPPIL